MSQPPQDPPIITGPCWGPRHTEAAVLDRLHRCGGYPDLCRAGIWHAVITCCLACGSADGTTAGRPGGGAGMSTGCQIARRVHLIHLSAGRHCHD